ncbi:histidine phosphatase family protein [Desulfobulbus sp.]|uniref:SixA phosphatase family protein n=1 Tax=Desulfobulbus sp. TaxID=895 RepID=UPI00286F819D|nr:histidine phosphatase family protein [Desulfobulbus sp.]
MKSKNSLQSDSLRLLICRHAKSSWQDASLGDFDRPLNKRGERDAPEMGRRLARRGLRPDLIVTSSAVRALATALHYARQLDIPPEQVRRNRAQYSASVPELIELIRTVDPDVSTLMLVGHNPESTGLANVLGGLRIDNIPTCGIVGLAFPQRTWAEIETGTGTLLFFDYPKKQE